MRKMVTLVLVAGLVALAALALVLTITRDDESFKIGAILPLTGDVATYGVEIRQGIETAVAEINAAGGVAGKNLVVLFEDSKAQPADGIAALRKLTSVNQVPAVIGAVASSVTLALAPVAEQSEVVLLSPASSSPEISTAGDYIFRNYPSDELEGTLVAEHAYHKGCRKVAIFTINNDYGNGLNRVFGREFVDIGGTMAFNDKFKEGERDFRGTLGRIDDREPDCIFIVGYGQELGLIVRQARELGISSQFYSTVNFHDPTSISTGGSAVNGVVFSSPVFSVGNQDPQVQNFVSSFQDLHGEEPDVWSAHGYDAALLIATAIASHGASPQAIRDGLYAISDYPGAAGITTFDSNGDVIKKARFMTVSDSRFIPVNSVNDN